MIYISLGSNLGDRLHYLQRATDLLQSRCLREISCSIVLETECLLLEGSPPSWNIPYLNMVVAGRSDLSPHELLATLKDIERELGRPEKYQRWSPRVIDLDILLWDDVVVDTPDLKIPHTELHNRPFLTHLLAMMGMRRFQAATAPHCFIKSLVVAPHLVGIVNITPDSFSDGGNFDGATQAIEHALKLAEDGASIIEIGAQSTRPGASIRTPEEEFACLAPVLKGLMPSLQNKSMTLSVDSFNPTTIRKILENYPVAWINDVTGALDDETLKLIAKKGCHLCVTHSLTVPPAKNVVLPLDGDPIDDIMIWAKDYINHLQKRGFDKNSIIIDPGIGFGKTVYQNIEILRRLDEIKSLGVDILIGHSRKSYIDSFSLRPAPERDIETIAVSASLKHKADFLRVHNVADHIRFFVADHILRERRHAP